MCRKIIYGIVLTNYLEHARHYLELMLVPCALRFESSNQMGRYIMFSFPKINNINILQPTKIFNSNSNCFLMVAQTLNIMSK